MKICFISTVESSNHPRIAEFTNEALDNNFDVIFISPDRPDKKTDIVNYYLLHNVRYHFRNENDFWKTLFAIIERVFISWQALFCTIFIDCDVYQCYGPDAWIIGYINKLLKRNILIIDILETYESRSKAFPAITREKVRKILRSSMAFIGNKADYVLHVSQTRAELYKDIFEQYIVINNYPEINTINQIHKKLPSYIEDVNSRKIIIHAGPLRVNYAAKEILLSLELLSDKISDLVLLIPGGIKGPPDAFEKLLERLIELDIVRLLPKIPYDEVISIMKCSDLGLSLVLPIDLAHRYAFPRKFFEYLACGLPVVGSDVPDIREITEKWECGLVVKKEDPKLISEAIFQILTDPKMHNKMSENALLAAENELNWEKERIKVEKLYSEIYKKSK